MAICMNSIEMSSLSSLHLVKAQASLSKEVNTLLPVLLRPLAVLVCVN